MNTMAASSPRSADRRLKDLLAGLPAGEPPETEDVRFLLGLSDGRLIDQVFKAARDLRQEHFGEGAFLYGFIYFSTFCRNDCTFCRYRKSNLALPRFRKSTDSILTAAMRLAEAGVHLIDLTMGEDPRLFEAGSEDGGLLVEAVRAVKAATGLPIMVSPGVVPAELLGRLVHAGADWYACYQETHSPALFAKLRPGQEFTERWQVKLSAREKGLLLEEGILCMAGETAEDIAASLAMMRALEADQLRAMTFVPQEGTPMASGPAPDRLRELLVIAMLRVCFPDRLIPASLDVEGLAGLPSRLDAGANVITSLIAPGSGMTGVASLTRDIENSQRMPSGLRSVLTRCGLKPADREAYRRWMRRRRRMPPRRMRDSTSSS
jgi:methylornithine synthase